MNTTATVETLTAEVRVLMVGNRQITLSVAKQLDRLSFCVDSPECIEPFGRVKTGTKIFVLNKDFTESMVTPLVEVIGRSNRDEDRGSLVIFEVGRGDEANDQQDTAALNRWMQLPLIVLAGLR